MTNPKEKSEDNKHQRPTPMIKIPITNQDKIL
jgi:hypothetical protein